MGTRAFRPFFLCYLVLCSGCLARQVACDGNAFHSAVADMYSHQAMENLVRARCNLPFVQLRYYQLNVTDSDDYANNGSAVQTVTTSRDLFAAAATRALTNVYTLGGLLD